MEDLTLHQIRISVLWLLATMALFGYAYIASDEEPSVLSNTSLVSDEELANASIVLMALAFLSLILKGSTNRLTNLIGGSVVGLGTLVALVDAVNVNPDGIYNLMMGVVVVMMAFIIWFAYKMPKKQA